MSCAKISSAGTSLRRLEETSSTAARNCWTEFSSSAMRAASAADATDAGVADDVVGTVASAAAVAVGFD